MKRVLVLGKNGFVSKSFSKYMEQFKNKYELVYVTSRKHEWEKYDFSGFDAVFNASGLAHAIRRH